MIQNGKRSYDLMLCGGGVIGLSIAYQSALSGWKVLLVDAGKIGQSASWAGAGILPAGASVEALDPTEQLRSLSHRLHSVWSQQLLELTGIDNEYRHCGGLYLARSAAERATLAAHRMWWEEHGIPYEAWPLDELVLRMPSLGDLANRNKDLLSWYVPDDCRLRNPRHIQALIAACSRLGVQLEPDTRIDRLEADKNRIVAAQCGSSRFVADRFCITTGAWATQLLGPIGIETGILPVRGQMVLFKLDRPHFSIVINDGHRYLVPRDDGHVLAGSCEEEVGFDIRTTDPMIEQLKDWAITICPKLSASNCVKSWAGLRPGSLDSLPYMGTLHPYKNAFIAAGHFRHGLHWSTATGMLMFQWMSDQKTDIDLKPFCVQRGQTGGQELFLKP